MNQTLVFGQFNGKDLKLEWKIQLYEAFQPTLSSEKRREADVFKNANKDCRIVPKKIYSFNTS